MEQSDSLDNVDSNVFVMAITGQPFPLIFVQFSMF